MPTLDFKGKSHIYAHHLTVPYRCLVPDPGRSIIRTNVGGGGRPSSVGTPDGNLVIHGDNLHALKALLPTHAGRVKCIYIDPPYNTGNENWVYSDRLNSQSLAHWFDANKPVDGEDLERHDKWLCMMWPRLQLLRELLSDDGVIFVSIDDNEQHHLRVIMDEIFGHRNLVAQIPWKARAVHNDTDISVAHEYILSYAKSRRLVNRRLKPSNAETWHTDPGFAMFPSELTGEGFSNPDNDPRGPWKTDNFDAPNIRPNLTYEIANPNSGRIFMPPAGRCWRMTNSRYMENLKDGRIHFGSDGNGKPQLKVFFNEVVKFGKVETTWFDSALNGTVSRGTREVDTIFGIKKAFHHPKPTQLLVHLLKLSTRDDDIVLDSFAGSGTTAHAVLALNKEDGGNRKFILVECEDYADSITAERVRRVIRGVPSAKDAALRDGLGGEFTYCTLGDPITVEDMLEGKSMPAFDQLAAYLINCATGAPVVLSDLLKPDDTGFDCETSFVWESERQRFHLFYRPDAEWLSSNDGALNSERAERIADDAKSAGKSAVVFGPVRYMNSADLSALGITFCQLPYELNATRARLS